MRRFEGWEPRTFYHYDDDGRLIESIAEPEWDHQEQAEMLALDLYRKGRCRHCGGNLDETTAPRNEERYRSMLPVQCHRCVAFAQAEEQYREHPQATSLLHRVELRR